MPNLFWHSLALKQNTDKTHPLNFYRSQLLRFFLWELTSLSHCISFLLVNINIVFYLAKANSHYWVLIYITSQKYLPGQLLPSYNSFLFDIQVRILLIFLPSWDFLFVFFSSNSFRFPSSFYFLGFGGSLLQLVNCNCILLDHVIHSHWLKYDGGGQLSESRLMYP